MIRLPPLPAAAAAAVLLALAAPARATTAAEVGGCGTAPQQVVPANPSNYRPLLAGLGPGQALLLAPGTYTQGLPFDGHHGQPGSCIVVSGPPGWPPTARFTVTGCCNTVSFRDSSYVVVRNLDIDGTGNTIGADGVKAESDANPPLQPGDVTHHITLENLWIHDFDRVNGQPSQPTVCISTKAPAWNWVVRDSVLERCGTGLYFGNSDGTGELVASLIEHNLITDSLGYNAQIKHQVERNTALGVPASGQTIIRHNVFAKGATASSGADARPNLLVGHWPPSPTAGFDDNYLIYGNFFHQNPTVGQSQLPGEPLFQGEGNVYFYENLLVNDDGPGVLIRPHNGVPRRIRVVHNTVVVGGVGIEVSGGAPNPGNDPMLGQLVIANAVFAAVPVSLPGNDNPAVQSDNTLGTRSQSELYLHQPLAALGQGLDLFPLPGSLQGSSELATVEDANRDFNGTHRGVPSYRGAYGHPGDNPGWSLALSRKPFFVERSETGNLARWSDTVP